MKVLRRRLTARIAATIDPGIETQTVKMMASAKNENSIPIALPAMANLPALSSVSRTGFRLERYVPDEMVPDHRVHEAAF